MAAPNNGFKGFGRGGDTRVVRQKPNGSELTDGSIVVASITSCTNTSNPTVMIGAGLLAKKAVQHGLTVADSIKTSLSPGSRVVGDYLARSGLQPSLDALGFHVVGYGCMTCVGNSGELLDKATAAVTRQSDVPPVLAAVLSGNRNFEARVHPLVPAAYLVSPPLVVAFALAGRVDIDLTSEPIGVSKLTGEPLFLCDLWPSAEEIRKIEETVIESARCRELYGPALLCKDRSDFESWNGLNFNRYAASLAGDENWQALATPDGALFEYDAKSTYIQPPPFLQGVALEPLPKQNVFDAVRCLLLLGDSVTTDHISPVSRIAADSHAGQYLLQSGVAQKDFGSYGTRRGNAGVMVRGTFANSKLSNALAKRSGPYTTHLPSGDEVFIAEASARYIADRTPLLVIAGSEYGQGSARDWAAKGTALLGVQFVLARSFERIHRSNLVGMGVAPLQFLAGADAASLGLTGTEHFSITLPEDAFPADERVSIHVDRKDGSLPFHFCVKLRLDTLVEIEFFRHGGVMPYVMRALAGAR